MPQQAIIIGLGQFGTSLTHSLVERGTEVLAVDKRQDLVDAVASVATEAIALDVTDEDALARLQPARRDVVICAIGDESRESSILCVALLRQMGTPLIIARAGDRLHQRILKTVGAHEVVNPERDFGQRLASRLAFRNVISDLPLGDNIHITEVQAPESFFGKTLKDLALPRKHGIMVAAIRRGSPSKVVQPRPDDPLQKDDKLILVSEGSAVPKMLESE